MSDKPADSTTQPPVPAAARARPIPAYVPEDFVPLWQWYQQHGTLALSAVCVVALLAAGGAFYQRHRAALAAKASEQLASSDTIDALEGTVKLYGSTAPGVAAKLKLAKAYYDAGKYADALDTYDRFVKQHPAHPFIGTAQVGRGFALTALNRADEALDAFRTFEKANPEHYLIPQAILGEASCLTILGKKGEAKALLEDLRAAHRESAWELAAKRMEGVVDRYTGARPETRQLLDQSSSLAPLTGLGAPRAPAAAPAGTSTAPVIVR